MIRPLLPSVVPRRRATRAAGRAAGAASGASCLLPAAAGAQPLAVPLALSGHGASTAVALLAWGVTLLGAVGLLLWALRGQRQVRARAAELQQARAEVHALRAVLDVCQWRTDAAHRLIEWHVPPQHDAALPSLPQGTPLWELFSGAVDATPLRQRLDQHAPLPSLRATVADRSHTRPFAFVLQAQPVLDAEGRFAGHVGTARPVQDDAVTLLTEVLTSFPGPVLRIALPARGAGPRLLAHNGAAGAWLPSTPAPSPSWDDLVDGLPPGIRPLLEQAIAHPGRPAVEAPGGWTLRSHRLPCGAHTGEDGELLVVFHRAGPSPDARPTLPADDPESFSYTVSHDLRAPIRVVEGFTKIVKEDYGHALDRIGNDHLDRVLAAAARMNSMIDALLALAQLSSRPLARQPVNLSMLAGYIIDDLRRQSPDRDVEVHIEPGLQAHGDATLLRVVLENLLGNAWKYTGKCRMGRIWFEASEHEGRPAVTVRDNGAGFDMRFADRLFGVFQRLHSANDFQGTGIGLASVRRIVRRHGGDIWAEAEVDRGARFQFWLGP